MDIPDDICTVIEQTVTDCLASELRARGLLLTTRRFADAARQAESDGRRLLAELIHRCYPLSSYDPQLLTLEFESEREASRVRSTLAFGAATAGLLMSPRQPERRIGSIALLGAIFNLGVGMLDGLCDEDTPTGLQLLGLLHLGDVADAASKPRPRGWLRVQLPSDLEHDPTVSFAADIVETFFATLHAIFPGDPWLDVRSRVGGQLAAALEAERCSLVSSPATTSPVQLTQYSYATSVLPFEIVGSLAQGAELTDRATLLGEAVWRIDDLVDLCDDARTGSLNAVLIAATRGGTDLSVDLPLLLDHIPRAAADAAERLMRGLEAADGCLDTSSCDVFLQFIARYAGLSPQETL